MNIDREIAENIMGWGLEEVNVGGPRWFKKGTPISIRAEYEWHPSTDIKQAFEVVGKMRERGFICHLYQYGDCDEWCAEFEFIKDNHIRGEADHENPATAICLAAIKVIGE